MNKVELIGNLCRDNDIRYAQGENANATLRNTVAVQRKYKNKDTNKYDSDFIPIVCFGTTAEFVNKYFAKGSKIAIVGRIQTGNYTNKQGEKVYTTDVVVEEVEFASSKNENTTTNNNNSAPQDNSFVDNIPEGLEDSLPFK